VSKADILAEIPKLSHADCREIGRLLFEVETDAEEYRLSFPLHLKPRSCRSGDHAAILFSNWNSEFSTIAADVTDSANSKVCPQPSILPRMPSKGREPWIGLSRAQL
jgi:hypothetical protein